MSKELFHIRWRFMKGITLERSHSIANSVARASQDQETWSTVRGSLKETTIKVQQMWRELLRSGEDSWGELHWREAIQLHEVWQELLRIKTLKKYHQRIHEGKTIEISGAFPHHDAWKEWHWKEAIQVHEVWQELLMIMGFEEMIRGSMKETTVEVHQMW